MANRQWVGTPGVFVLPHAKELTVHAIILAGQIPGGPYPPPVPSGTPWAWGIIAFFAFGLLCRLATRANRGRRR